MKKIVLFVALFAFAAQGWAQDDDSLTEIESATTETEPEVELQAASPAPAAPVASAAQVATAAPAASKPSIWGTKSIHRKGLWAVGVDAAPVLNLGLNVINLFNNTGQDATNVLQNPANLDQTLALKYYLRDDLAIRGMVRLGSASTTTITYYEDPRDVVDPEVDAGNRTEVQDTRSESASLFTVGGGAEWRHSFGRIEGFCGAEALMGFGSSSVSTTYGWSYVDADNIPAEQTAGRILSEDYGTSISLGGRGFVGMEYFIIPEISLAAEYGIGGTFNLTPNGVVVTEVWEVTTNDEGETSGKARNREAKTDASQVVALSNDMGLGQTAANSAFALRLNFHF